MGKLEIAVLIGGESKQFLADLNAALDRAEALIAKPSTGEALAADVAKEEKAKAGKAKPATSKKAAAKVEAEDDESFDLGEDDAEETEAEDEPVTKKDLIAACRDNREGAIKALKKLKVASIHELKPTQYRTVLNAIGV